jgi:hypothetical protein
MKTCTEYEHGTGVERKRVMEPPVRKRVTTSVLYRPALRRTATESGALARCPTRGKNVVGGIGISTGWLALKAQQLAGR